MVGRGKYRRTPDLYTEGKTVLLKDGNTVYLRVLNPYERDECIQDASAARGRLVMALEQIGSDEQTAIAAAFRQTGREAAINLLLNSFESTSLMTVLNEIQDDPDWKEKLAITDRNEELMAKPVSDPERQLLDKINEEYLAEVRARTESRKEGEKFRLDLLPDEELEKEYMELWRKRRGDELAQSEYQITELWYAVRCCDAKERTPEDVSEDEKWDHSECEGHRMRLYETKSEVRELPNSLQTLFRETMFELNMTVREAKNSDRPQSSSVSSLPPSEGAESTPSTPEATPATQPGTSQPQSATA